VFRDIKLVGTLVGRNAQSRAILIFAAKHGVRAKMKTYSLERLNELVGDYHRGPKRSVIVAISTREVHAHKVGMPKDARPWDARLERCTPLKYMAVTSTLIGYAPMRYTSMGSCLCDERS
jgi:hypothetical protein